MAKTSEKLNDIMMFLKWGNISKEYMGHSRSWIYQLLNGYDSNGNPSDFNEAQREELKNALKDLAARITAAADSI